MKLHILNIISTQILKEYWQCRYFSEFCFATSGFSFEGSLYPSHRCNGLKQAGEG